jgi:hypothetical protein
VLRTELGLRTVHTACRAVLRTALGSGAVLPSEVVVPWLHVTYEISPYQTFICRFDGCVQSRRSGRVEPKSVKISKSEMKFWPIKETCFLYELWYWGPKNGKTALAFRHVAILDVVRKIFAARLASLASPTSTMPTVDAPHVP